MSLSKIVLSAAVIVSVFATGVVSTAQQSGRVPFNSLPSPTFDSGWILAEPGGEGFPIAHPVGDDIFSALISSESREPGRARVVQNFWEADPNQVVVNRGLFSPREVRVRIWVTR